MGLNTTLSVFEVVIEGVIVVIEDVLKVTEERHFYSKTTPN